MIKSSSLASAQQHRNLSDRVAHHLMDHIRTNRLASGERLPSEVRLSAELKISRGIVREAYRALRSAGILEISNGRSPRVGALRSASLIHLLQHALATQQASPEQALDLRAAIEVRAAELAAEKRSADDIEVLTRAVRGMKRARRDIDALRAARRALSRVPGRGDRQSAVRAHLQRAGRGDGDLGSRRHGEPQRSGAGASRCRVAPGHRRCGRRERSEACGRLHGAPLRGSTSRAGQARARKEQ